jgi:hypothetical protein
VASVYDLGAVVRWRVESSRQTDGALSLEVERAALAREQRKKAERENRISEGGYLTVAEVEAAFEAIGKGVNAKLLVLAKMARARGVITREQEAGVHALAREALIGMAQWRTIEDASADPKDKKVA